MKLPIRVRLTLASTVMMAVVLVTVGVLISVGFRIQQNDVTEAGLTARAKQTVALIDEGRKPFRQGVGEPDEAFGQVLTADGSVLESSVAVRGTVLLDAAELAQVDGPTFIDRTVSTTEEPVPALLLAVPATDGTVVVLGASREDQRATERRLTVLSIGGGLLALVLAALVGWIVTGAALRPVEQMRREAAEVTSSELGRRLRVPPAEDELARLARTLNQMLDRLQSAVVREQRFVADASHELRTPLTNLRAEIELALRHPADASAMHAALGSSAEETDRLIRLTHDLLLLAQSGSDQPVVSPEPTDLLALANAAAASFGVRADERQVAVRVTVPSGFTVNVDPERFREVLENLVDNALRHSPAGGVVEIAGTRADGVCTVTVDDAGPGFAADFLDEAFEPFSRADQGRARKAGGTGLGLAIVRAIVEAHGGTVRATNRSPVGARLTIELPRA